MNFEKRLTGGHPNSLGNTVESVEEVLADSSKFNGLFNCYFNEDEVVRLRVSNAMKRICKEEPELLIPYLDRLLNEIAKIDQASMETLFQWSEEDEELRNWLLPHLKRLSNDERKSVSKRASKILTILS